MGIAKQQSISSRQLHSAGDNTRQRNAEESNADWDIRKYIIMMMNNGVVRYAFWIVRCSPGLGWNGQKQNNIKYVCVAWLDGYIGWELEMGVTNVFWVDMTMKWWDTCGGTRKQYRSAMRRQVNGWRRLNDLAHTNSIYIYEWGVVRACAATNVKNIRSRRNSTTLHGGATT